MRYGPQDDFAEPVLLRPRAESGAHQSFNYRVDGPHLPPLTVPASQLRELFPHHSAPSPRRRFAGGAASRRLEDGPDSQRANRPVQPLGIEIGVGQQRPEPGSADGLPQRPTKLDQVRPGPASRDRRGDHVAATIDREDDLGVPGV